MEELNLGKGIYQLMQESLTREKISNWFYDRIPPRENRSIRVYTGVNGYDRFQEMMEEVGGFTRVYIGRKVPRILRLLRGTIKLSPRNKYYKLKRNELSKNTI